MEAARASRALPEAVLTWCVWALISGAVAAQTTVPTNVLTLHWGPEDFPANVAIDAGIREVLRPDPAAGVDYHAEYLESDRFPTEDASLAFRDYVRRKYQGRRIDVVVAVTDVALEFALRHRAELFPDAPIVFSAVTPPGPDARDAGAGVTGITTGSLIGQTLALALRLHPSTERIFVVAEAPDDNFQAAMQQTLRSFERTVSLTYLSGLSVNELAAAVRRVPERSFILYVRYSQDQPGQVLLPSEVAGIVARSAAVPVYGSAESYMGSGVVGGVIWPQNSLGKRLGEMAVQILKGQKAKDIPIEQPRPVPTFDWRQLRRWSIDASRLPAGSVTLFREFSAWELYRWYIVGAVGVIALQGLTIAALIALRARRRETEARNSAILRAVPDLMFLQTKDGAYIDYHAPDDGQLLMRPDQFLGRNMRDVLPATALRTLGPSFERAAQGQEPQPVEYELLLPDRAHHYEARMVPCKDDQVLSIVRDITERKHAEAALREGQNRYALATAAGGVGVWDWNLETNEIFVDPSLKALLGFEDAEIRNHLDDWGRRVHPEDVPAVMARASAHIAGETPAYEVEHRMLHKDGTVRWFIARGSAVQWKDGKPVRIIGTDMDITERKQSDGELHEAQAELARVSRLTALGEFAASIAHEVSQPLTAIVMNAKTCLRWAASESPDMSEIRAALSDVVESGKRADEVIRRNRELFQYHAVETAPLDVNSVIQDVAVLTRSHLQRSHVTLETDLAGDLPSVLGDRVELQQVLLNLILNAVDAMASVDPSSRRLRIESRLAGDAVVQVAVCDAGVGLSGVDLKRIFTPSYTTKPKGTGVGLSICRSIIQAHGGRVWAVQNDEGGATFSFTVPVPGGQASKDRVIG